MLAIKDVQRIFRAGAWATGAEIDAFVQEAGAIPASELSKLLALLLDRAVAQGDLRAHQARCHAFAKLADLSGDPELFKVCLKALKQSDGITLQMLTAVLPKVNQVSGHTELCQLLGAPDEAVRKAAAHVLKQVAGKTAFEILSDLCSDTNFGGKIEAMDVLVPKAGHHAIPFLAIVLKHGKIPERHHALKYLADARYMAKDVPGAMRTLAGAIEDPDERLVSFAISSLAAIASEEDFFRALGPKLESQSLPTLKAIMDGLKHYKSERTIAYLNQRFMQGPTSVRLLVLDAYAGIGDENVLPNLVDALAHRQLPVRTKAGEVVSQLAVAGKIDAARTIVWLLRMRDTNIRRMATEIAKKVGDKSGELTPKLLNFLRDEDWWVRERVMDALVEMAGPTLAQHLIGYLSDPSDVVRRFAVGALLRLKDPRTIGTFVRSAMNDTDWWVREQAIEAIAQLKDKRAIPYVLDVLARHEDQRLVCIQALRALEAQEASEQIAVFLDDPDQDVRLAAVQALGALEARALAPKIKEHDQDDAHRVRNAVRELLARWQIAGDGPVEDRTMNLLDRLLSAVQQAGADDLILAASRQPYVKKMGKMEPLSRTVLTDDQVKAILYPHLTPNQLADLEKARDVDFSYEVVARGLRFRGHVFSQQTGVSAVFRIVKNDIPNIDKLELPAVAKTFGDLKNGLILVGGPTGAGKSTTLAAIIDQINRTSARHIVSIEDPIEVVHTMKRSLINQREVGTHTLAFSSALRATLRQDPDVLLVGEMRDYETIQFAVSAAETGHLVFGTVHTVSADSSIDRLINAFPSGQQPQVRSMLAETLRAVLCQHLLRRADGKGRAIACEVMLNNDAISNMIRKGKAFQIATVIQSSRDQGMQSMDSELARLVKAGIVTVEEAYAKATDKKVFEANVAPPKVPEGVAPKTSMQMPAVRPGVRAGG